MSAKRKRKRNPLLAKKYDEGFEDGVRSGVSLSVKFFKDKLNELENTKGIGAKTMQAIKDNLGHEYFD